MRFHLSQEQIAIQDAVRGVLSDNWSLERLHAFAEGAEDTDPRSWRALMDLGLGGILVDDAVGGAGLALLEAALVCEIAGASAASTPLATQMVVARAVSRSSNAAAKERLGSIISGDAIATVAFGDGWLPSTWTARPEGGTVRFVPAGRTADLFLLGTEGGGLSLVEAGAGLTVSGVPSTDRSRPMSSVTFDNARAHDLFGPGDPIVEQIFDALLVLTAADSLGGAQHCLDQVVDYAKQREQFGQPIARFQALKHQLAHIALDVEPARALVWYAAYAADAGLSDARHAAAMAKAHLCDVYVRATRASVAAHGGIGYTWEYGLNYWFRRAVANQAMYANSTVHRARAADLAGW